MTHLRFLTDLPVGYLVNTHYHPDHVWGNGIFRAEGAVIIARPETAIEMERYSPVYRDYYRERKPAVFEMIRDVELALPDSLVTGNIVLDLGGTEVAVDFHGPAHTAGDLVVPLAIDDYTRWRLMEGLDDIGLTLQQVDAISEYEQSRPSFKPVTLRP